MIPKGTIPAALMSLHSIFMALPATADQVFEGSGAEECIYHEGLSRQFSSRISTAQLGFGDSSQVLTESLDYIEGHAADDQSGPFRVSYCSAMPALIQALNDYPRESDDPFFHSSVREANIEARQKIFATMAFLTLEYAESQHDIDTLFTLLEHEQDADVTSEALGEMLAHMRAKRIAGETYPAYRTQAIAEQVLSILEDRHIPHSRMSGINLVEEAAYTQPALLDQLFSIAPDDPMFMIALGNSSRDSAFPREIASMDVQLAMLDTYANILNYKYAIPQHVILAMDGLSKMVEADLDTADQALDMIKHAVEHGFENPKVHDEAARALRRMTYMADNPEDAIRYIDLWDSWLDPNSQVLGASDQTHFWVIFENPDLQIMASESDALNEALSDLYSRVQDYPFEQRRSYPVINRTAGLNIRKTDFLPLYETLAAD